VRHCLALLLVSLTSLYGQYTFRSWQAEDGLPVNLVRSIVQAADGHLWIATAEGLARFDGIDFERIATPPGVDFPNPGPGRLFATADGAVWYAGSRGGLVRFSRAGAAVVWPDEESAAPVTQLSDWPNHGVTIRRGDGFWAFRQGETTRLDPATPGLQAHFAADLEERARTGRLGPDGTAGDLVDRGGAVWSVSAKGELKVTSPEGSPRPVTAPRARPDFQVTEMLQDREGNIWVATAFNGLGLFREERVNVLNAAAGLSAAAVLGVLEDSRGQLWIGNRDGGVDRLREGRVEHQELSAGGANQLVSALYEDRDGRMWAATMDGPVFMWRDSRFVVPFPDATGPAKVNSIYQDKDGTLWFAGQQGLARSVSRRITQVEEEAGFPGGEVTVLAGGAADELWLGTAQGFVLRNAAGRLQTIGTPGDLAYSRVTGLLVSAADQVWVTTLGAGLFLFDGGRWQRFERPQGLPDLRLTGVLDDQLGHLWFGSTGGILRASRADLLARARNPDASIHWLRMDRSDGLPTRECVVGHHPAGWRCANGSLWFPTHLGMVRLDPSRTLVNRTPPPVFLRSVRAGGVELKPGNGRLTAGPGRTRLEFRYRGLNFSAPEKVTYRTRLVGLHETWRDDGTQRLATYESVPPGRYRFEVLAMNGDGFQSQTPAVVELEIRPRFWETGWFVAQVTVVVIFVAGAVGWIIARSRLNRRITLLKIHQAREAERARIARDLHDDLGASLTEFSLLTDLGAEQAAGSPFQAQIEQLSDKSRALGQALDEIVWAVNPREDSLASLINYLATFATEFLDRAGISLRLDIATGLPALPLDATVRHSVFLAVRETFNNLVKHSHARTAWLKVTFQEGVLEVVVEDDGCGVAPDARSRGDGLTNFESRMAACHGRVVVAPRPAGGTAVRFIIPLLAFPPDRP
jgi:ligand-binding sensor domain-containing protein/signal transduction histidine kinase